MKYTPLSDTELTNFVAEHDGDPRVTRLLAERRQLLDIAHRRHVRCSELLEEVRALRGQDLPVRVFLRPGAKLPFYASSGAACADLHAYLDAPLEVAPGACVLVPTGVHVAIPDGWEWQIRPRSGMSARAHWTAWGTVDSDYRGEVKVAFVNLANWQVTIEPGDRIAQAKLERVTRARWEPVGSVEDLGTTERGVAGFGSTGQ